MWCPRCAAVRDKSILTVLSRSDHFIKETLRVLGRFAWRGDLDISIPAMSIRTRTHSIESFKFLASTFMAAAGDSHWALSQKLFGDGQKLKAILESGADLTSRRLDKALWWLSDNWPKDTPWPQQFPRP